MFPDFSLIYDYHLSLALIYHILKKKAN